MQLEGKKFLVGDSLSLADVVVASALMEPSQTVLDGGFRKGKLMKNLEPWIIRGSPGSTSRTLRELCAARLPTGAEKPRGTRGADILRAG